MSVLRPLLSACVMLPLWSGTALAEQSSAEPVKQAEVKAEGPCAVIFSEVAQAHATRDASFLGSCHVLRSPARSQLM
jgi:hypothetical protein